MRYWVPELLVNYKEVIMFKGLIKWVKWLTVDAPTGITRLQEEKTCDYCNLDEHGLIYYAEADFTICQVCLKQTFDEVLKG